MYQKIKSGFTIVELSLAIAFIAMLSIIVALIINNSISAYHRGITLNQLNTTGMDVVEDMRKAIQESPALVAKNECSDLYGGSSGALKTCEEKEGQSFVSMTRSAIIKKRNDSKVTLGGETPVAGVFCTGKYSYIWNSGYFNEESEYGAADATQLTFKYKYMDSSKVSTNKEKTPKEGEKSGFKLLKIEDDTRAVCKAAAGGLNGVYSDKITDNNNTIDISCSKVNNAEASTEICNALEAEPEDILEGSSNLALYGLTVGTPAMGGNSKSMLYSVSLVLGTIQGGINIKTSGNYCATPEGAESDIENFDYCAINKFNFAARTTGG